MRRETDPTETTPFAPALKAAEELLSSLREDPAFAAVQVAGALRRFDPEVRRLELVAAAPVPAAAASRLAAHPATAELLSLEGGECEVRLADGPRARLLAVVPEAFGAALLFRTGAPGHRQRLVDRARALGLSWKDGALLDPAGRPLSVPTEEDAFHALAYSPVPPELREAGDELDDPALPPVVRPTDLRGLAHAHTRWSDGRHTVAEMARAARALGFSWIAVTDHSPSGSPGGLTVDRLKAQREAVERAREEVPGIAILHGAEVDILEDGTLEYPDDVLAWLDLVVASLHRPLDRDEATQTRRLVAALRHPLVSWLGHPTGAYHGLHDAYPVRLDELFAVAAETGKALEVNGNPGRLDLSAEAVRDAVAAGVRLVAAADAHSLAHLGRSFHAAHTAARGRATAGDVLNTLPVAAFLRAVGRPAVADRYAAASGSAAAGSAGAAAADASRATSTRS